MTAIIGGLSAAVLWAPATLFVALEPDDRLAGGAGLGHGRRHGRRPPAGHVSPGPGDRRAVDLVPCSSVGLCYVVGLDVDLRRAPNRQGLDRGADRRDRGRRRGPDRGRAGRPSGLRGRALLAVIAAGVVLAAIEPARPDVPAGDIDLAADAIDGPARDEARARIAGHAVLVADDAVRTRKTVVLSAAGALIFGVGLAAAGTAATSLRPHTSSTTPGTTAGRSRMRLRDPYPVVTPTRASGCNRASPVARGRLSTASDARDRSDGAPLRTWHPPRKDDIGADGVSLDLRVGRVGRSSRSPSASPPGG